MSTIRVQTTQNITLEFELGSLGDRILGRLVDLLVLGAYVIAVVVIMVSGGRSGFDKVPWLWILLMLPVVGYDLFMEVFFDGQSLGKKAMEIRVVSLDGNRPGLGQFLIRWLFRLVDFTLTQSLCAVISVAASQQHQRLGDMVAGTAVIKTRIRTTMAETLYVPIPDHYEVRFPEAAHLKPRDIQLIKEVLQNHSHANNLLLMHHAAEKIMEVLHIQSPMEPLVFLHTLIADYNYLCTRA